MTFQAVRPSEGGSSPAPSLPRFPSMAWCLALVNAIHEDERSLKAGKGWRGTIAVAVLADAYLKEPFIVFAEICDGRVLKLTQLEDEDEIDEVEPDYVAKGSCETWARFVQGTLDPIEALLQGGITFRGDLAPIAQRTRFKQLIWDTLEKVPAQFPDMPRR